MNHRRSTRHPALLLTGFVLASALVHTTFLAIRFDDERGKVHLVHSAPPLQVVVLSSRGEMNDEAQAATIKAVSRESATPVDKSAASATSTSNLKTVEKPQQAEQPRVENVTATTPEQASPAKTSKPPTKHATESKRIAAPVNHLHAELHNQLARHFTYPRLARRMGWEGQVGLGLHIEEDGSLHKIRILRSSGYKVLDENARSTLNRIGRITVASNMVIDPVDTEIDVQYRLTD